MQNNDCCTFLATRINELQATSQIKYLDNPYQLHGRQVCSRRRFEITPNVKYGFTITWTGISIYIIFAHFVIVIFMLSITDIIKLSFGVRIDSVITNNNWWCFKESVIKSKIVTKFFSRSTSNVFAGFFYNMKGICNNNNNNNLTIS